MQEKYVFFDIDGTIYDYKKGIPDSTREAISRLRDNGHHPVICTGRTKIMIFEEILDLGFDGIISGAGTYAQWQGKPLYLEEITAEDAARIIDILRQNRFIIFAEGHEYLYYDPLSVDAKNNDIYKIYKRNIPENVRPIDLDTQMHISKISAEYTPECNMLRAREQLGEGYAYVDHYGLLLETIPKTISKGDGVRRLMSYLGASMEDTVGFGDSMNDYEMLTTVKNGVVMGNAKEDLKALIANQTESMFDDGVFNALRRMNLI